MPLEVPEPPEPEPEDPDEPPEVEPLDEPLEVPPDDPEPLEPDEPLDPDELPELELPEDPPELPLELLPDELPPELPVAPLPFVPTVEPLFEDLLAVLPPQAIIKIKNKAARIIRNEEVNGAMRPVRDMKYLQKDRKTAEYLLNAMSFTAAVLPPYSGKLRVEGEGANAASLDEHVPADEKKTRRGDDRRQLGLRES
jgi:hypothetical protein